MCPDKQYVETCFRNTCWLKPNVELQKENCDLSQSFREKLS